MELIIMFNGFTFPQRRVRYTSWLIKFHTIETKNIEISIFNDHG